GGPCGTVEEGEGGGPGDDRDDDKGLRRASGAVAPAVATPRDGARAERAASQGAGQAGGQQVEARGACPGVERDPEQCRGPEPGRPEPGGTGLGGTPRHHEWACWASRRSRSAARTASS